MKIHYFGGDVEKICRGVMKPIIFLLLILGLQSCVSQHFFSPKISLIKEWNTNLAQSSPQGPNLATFTKDNKSLYFLGARHEYGLNSATFINIKKIIEEFNPQVIIVEGIPDLTDEKKERINKLAYQCAQDNFKTCGEDLFAIYLSLKNHIYWQSGEPKEAKLQEQLVLSGYPKKDIAFFYLVRQIRELINEKSLNELNFDLVANNYLQEKAKYAGLPAELNAHGFKKWYEEKMHKPFILSDIDSETTAPLVEPDASYLHRISAKIGLIRDQNLAQSIAEMLNKHQRVMVVYGHSHLLVQLDLLKNMFETK